METIFSVIIYIFLLFLSFKLFMLLFKFNLGPKPYIIIDPKDVISNNPNIIKCRNDIKLLDLKETLRKRVINR